MFKYALNKSIKIIINKRLDIKKLIYDKQTKNSYLVFFLVKLFKPFTMVKVWMEKCLKWLWSLATMTKKNKEYSLKLRIMSEKFQLSTFNKILWFREIKKKFQCVIFPLNIQHKVLKI